MDMNFYQPRGPLFHLDLFQIALGALGSSSAWGAKGLGRGRRSSGCAQPRQCEALLALPSCFTPVPNPPPTPHLCRPDCLPWCTIQDGVHVTSTVNEVLLQQLANMYLLWKAQRAAAAAAPAPTVPPALPATAKS